MRIPQNENSHISHPPQQTNAKYCEKRTRRFLIVRILYFTPNEISNNELISVILVCSIEPDSVILRTDAIALENVSWVLRAPNPTWDVAIVCSRQRWIRNESATPRAIVDAGRNE